MKLSEKLNKSIYMFIFLISLTMIQNDSSIDQCWGSTISPLSTVLSLSFQERPLIEVCRIISEKTGCEIEIDREWEALPITICLRNVAMKECITRILRDLDYAVIYLAENKIAVKIFNDNSKNKTLTLPKDEKLISSDHIKSKNLSSDQVVTPPIKPGGRGLTQRELDAIRVKAKSSQKSEVDPSTRIVTPPVTPEGRGLTQRELDAIRVKAKSSQQNDVDPSTRIVTPPVEPGGRGLTQQELNAIRAKSRSFQEGVDPLSNDIHLQKVDMPP